MAHLLFTIRENIVLTSFIDQPLSTLEGTKDSHDDKINSDTFNFLNTLALKDCIWQIQFQCILGQRIQRRNTCRFPSRSKCILDRWEMALRPPFYLFHASFAVILHAPDEALLNSCVPIY